MLGAVAGDIIGSPFEWLNTSDEGFELCRTNHGSWKGRAVAAHPHFTDDTVITLAVARWMMGDSDRSGRSLVGYMTDMAAQYPKAGYTPRFYRWLQSEYHNPTVSYGNGTAMRVSPVGMMLDDLADVVRVAAVSAEVSHNHPDSIGGAQAVAQAVWMARKGRSKDDIRFAMTHDFGYDIDMEEDSLRALLRGCAPEPVIVNGEDTGLIYYRETGLTDSSCKLSVTAALRAFLETDGYESAVRRSVALGGDCDTIAAICGSIAAPFYGGVPEKIAALCDTFLDAHLRSVMSSFEARCEGMRRQDNIQLQPKEPSDSLQVIRTPGYPPVFVVEKGRHDIGKVIREKFGADTEIIEPRHLQKRLASLREDPGDGTRLAAPQPDVRPLRFENGELKGPLTYGGPNAAPLSERQAAYSSMREILEFASGVKSELQRLSGFAEDGDVRYDRAYYPVIFHNRVDIYQGPYLDGSIELDEYAGVLRLVRDGEMRDGEYREADWCRERVFDNVSSPKDIAAVKAAIGRFCLDDGVGVHDVERRSNVDTATEDLALSRDPRINPPFSPAASQSPAAKIKP